MSASEDEAMVNLTQLAQDQAIVKDNLNKLFLLLMASLVFYMQVGFALLEGGAVRAKNVTNILVKNVTDTCFGMIAFWLTGYALAFGSGSPIIGLEYFVAIDMPLSEYAFFIFQATFATTCATIVSGAIAERSDYRGYMIFAVVITGFIYPVHTHWCWGPDGWLAQHGFYDFAGSGVIHLAGGVCAFVGAWLVGPRKGRFSDKEQIIMKPHSTTLTAQGFFILCFGFLAFNGGSQGGIGEAGDGGTVALIFTATLIAASAGGIVVFFEAKIQTGYWKLGPCVNGSLAGMVSVCCGCDGMYPWMAALSGTVAGLVYVVVANLMVRLKVDDPIDAVAVHGGAGAWGLVAGPLLRTGGILSSTPVAGLEMLLWNAIGMVCIIAWNAICSLCLFYTLLKLGLLRVPAEFEIVGLDKTKHDEISYPEFMDRNVDNWSLGSGENGVVPARNGHHNGITNVAAARTNGIGMTTVHDGGGPVFTSRRVGIKETKDKY